MRLSGVSLAVPAGWQAAARQNESGHVVLHAATIPLPRSRGDFGSDVALLLGADDVFCSLFEYDRASAATVLFAAHGLPVVRPSDFVVGALQRSLPGQSGAQYFFTQAGRPFCLFAVVGSHSRRVPGAARVNGLVRRMAIA